MEARARGDGDRQVVSVDERHIIVIQSIGGGESEPDEELVSDAVGTEGRFFEGEYELGERRWWDTSAGMRVAQETTVAATIETRVRAGV